MNDTMIELIDGVKIYGKGSSRVFALNGLSLQIQKGELVALMGPSGSGKSTLLNIIGCIDQLTSGSYLLDGTDIQNFSHMRLAQLRNKRFGFVLQDFGLIDHWTVSKNVEIPLSYAKPSDKKPKERIEQVLNQLQIADKKSELAYRLSGGQKQRVAIARAIVNDPQIILADEPTGALDQKTGREVLNILQKIHQAGKTVIIVTHDPTVAGACNRVIQIVDGKMKQEQ
ncbi:MAG: ABC transporter ATP-binding protein [Acutalibacteraceae bacterium]|nr:ABC transporter ATP-binding protein [Acutalibacteraceae bacterium]